MGRGEERGDEETTTCGDVSHLSLCEPRRFAVVLRVDCERAILERALILLEPQPRRRALGVQRCKERRARRRVLNERDGGCVLLGRLFEFAHG